MGIIQMNCMVKNNCKYKDMAICNYCTRNNIVMSDHFEMNTPSIVDSYKDIVQKNFDDKTKKNKL